MNQAKARKNKINRPLRPSGGDLVLPLTGKPLSRWFFSLPLFFSFLFNAAVILISLYFLVLPASPAKRGEPVVSNWPFEVLLETGSKVPRLLDGRPVLKEVSALRPFAVMLENHADSRPAAGLENASIIYESRVEGEITRFIAIFDGNISAKKIGPVRSARPFFIDLAEEWRLVYLHAGGSPAALQKLKAGPIFDLNEISSDGIYFFRDQGRIAPHNLFTSADLIKRAMLAKNIAAQADFSPWLFKNDRPAALADLVSEIKIDFSKTLEYRVKYQYEPQNNSYTRYQAGQVHKTEAGVILQAKNIVLQHVRARVLDAEGRLAVTLTGQGQAEIYQDGREIAGYWQKIAGRTRFYDNSGAEIRFNRGRIWVELVF